MRAADWVRDHKAKSGLIAIALANVFYLLWCTIADTPTSPLSKLLTPIVIVSAVLLKRSEVRESS